VCIRVETATTSAGIPVQFHSVSDLVEQFNVPVRTRSDGTSYGYSHEVVVTTSLVPGPGSCHVSYSTLVDNGLYSLYPALGEVLKREKVRLNFTVEDLRKHWLEEPWPLSWGKLELASRLTASFGSYPIAMSELQKQQTSRHLLSWFLALQHRSETDSVLQGWIESKQTLSSFSFPPVKSTSIPAVRRAPVEVRSYEALLPLLADVNVIRSLPTLTPAIGLLETQRDVGLWNAFRKKNKEDYRASHPERNQERDRRPRRGRREHTDRRDHDRVDRLPRYGTSRRG
jgi:hypothetical protein